MHFQIFIIVSIIASCVLCEEVETNSTETPDIKSSPATVSTPSATVGNDSCEQHSDCESCLKNSKCYYCEVGKRCTEYVLKEVLPNKECKLKNAYYGSCSINLLAVIILIGIGASIVFVGLIVCCCCCCCRKNGPIKLSKDDLKWARQREERKMKAEERRKERAAETEKIRHKYGLFKDDSPYQRFDA